MNTPSNHTDDLDSAACGVPVRLGPDGTPLVDDPIETAERLARLADELAALADQVTGVLAWQDAALAMVHPAVDDAGGRRYMFAARRVNTRLATSLMLLRDSLGEAHVTGDVLAEQLRHILTPHAAGAPMVRGAVA